MSARDSAVALRRADEALREALAALTQVSVTEHLLPGVEVKPAFFGYRGDGLYASILLDPREWSKDELGDRHWMVDQGTGRWWHSISIGRTALGRELTPEQRAPRTDAQMREMMTERITEVLTELGQQRVGQAVVMLAREAAEASS